MPLDVHVLSPKKVIFKGTAASVVVPGEQGIFEILPFHKNILSRLISGTLLVDSREFSIRRGIIKVDQNSVTMIVEEK